MKALWKSALVYSTGKTFSFALYKSSQQHKTEGKGFIDVHIIEKTVPFPSLLHAGKCVQPQGTVSEEIKILTSFKVTKYASRNLQGFTKKLKMIKVLLKMGCRYFWEFVSCDFCANCCIVMDTFPALSFKGTWSMGVHGRSDRAVDDRAILKALSWNKRDKQALKCRCVCRSSGLNRWTDTLGCEHLLKCLSDSRLRRVTTLTCRRPLKSRKVVPILWKGPTENEIKLKWPWWK